MTIREHRSQLLQSDIDELFPVAHFVTRIFATPGRLPMQFRRILTILREDDALTLLNSVVLQVRG